MPLSANTKAAGIVLVLLLAVLHPERSSAAGIEVREAATVQTGGQILLSARLVLELSDEVLKALDHGVAVDIVVDMAAVQERRWLWDRTIVEHSERFRLERQALSKHYLVTHGYRRRSFLSLAEALQYIGTIRNYPLIAVAELDGRHTYRGRLRAWLDIESLPPPMRPTAYVSSQWQIASNWHEWTIQAGNDSNARAAATENS